MSALHPNHAPNVHRILADLEQALALVSCEELPEVIGKLESIKTTALLRLMTPQASAPGNDQLLDVHQAAERLGISADYLYRNWQRFPFSMKVGGRVRFSQNGIDAFIAKRSGRNY